MMKWNIQPTIAPTLILGTFIPLNDSLITLFPGSSIFSSNLIAELIVSLSLILAGIVLGGILSFVFASRKRKQLQRSTNHATENQSDLDLQRLGINLNHVLSRVNASITSFRIFNDQNWEYDYISVGCEQVFGYTAQEFKTNQTLWLSRIHPDDRAVLDSIFETIFAGGTDVIEYRFCHKDGSIRWISETFTSRWDATASCWVVTLVSMDTSERKQTELALQESEERFRQMAESIREVFWMADIDLTQILYVSPAYEEIWGRSCASLYEQPSSFLDAIHPDDRDRVLAVMPQRQYSVNQEYRLLHPDGSIRWIWEQAFPVHDAAGNPYRIVGVSQDITDRKRAEIALQHQLEREQLMSQISQRIRHSLNLDEILKTTVAEVRRFFQTDRVFFYRFDPDWSGTVIAESVDPHWQSTLYQRLTVEHFIETQGEPFRGGEIWVADDIETMNLPEQYYTLLTQLQIRSTLVVPILPGEELWGMLVANHCSQPRHWHELEIDLLKQLATQVGLAIQQSELYQQVKQFNANLEDQVRERTATLQRSLELEALLKRVTDKVRDGLDESQILQTAVRELAIGLNILYCDAAWYDFAKGTVTIAYEYSRSAIQPAKGMVLPMANMPDVHHQIVQRQSVHFCPTPDASYAPRSRQQQFTILACPLMDDQGVFGNLWLLKPWHDCFDDLEIRVAEQVASQCAIAIRQARLYQAAQAQVEELEKLNQLKDDFLSTVSHELRTPISNIRMATQMLEILLKRSGLFDGHQAQVRQYFQILHNECQREISLVNDLLDLARLDADTDLITLTLIEPQHWIADIVEPFRQRTHNQQQQLKLDLPSSLPPVITDTNDLSRILNELLHNACKYTPAGETITVSARSTRDYIQINVSNSGVELSASELDRIFDKFYRVPNNDPWKHGGTGLGLALVKRLIERLGATIHTEIDNRTVSFTVNLPIAMSCSLPP